MNDKLGDRILKLKKKLTWIKWCYGQNKSQTHNVLISTILQHRINLITCPVICNVKKWPLDNVQLTLSHVSILCKMPNTSWTRSKCTCCPEFTYLIVQLQREGPFQEVVQNLLNNTIKNKTINSNQIGM